METGMNKKRSNNIGGIENINDVETKVGPFVPKIDHSMKKMKGSSFFFLLKNGDWLEQVIW
jgi:hypothetical protein